MVNDRTATRKGGEKKAEKKAGPRTRIGSKRGPRVRDLVEVKDPRDGGQTFTAEVTGGYTLAGVWHVQLAPPPSSPKGREQRIPRQSTKASFIRGVYRRQA